MLLDLGSGAGHVSFISSPLVKEVIAYDLSSDMLDIMKKEAKNRNLININVKQGHSSQLPFEDNHFDLVVSRFSAHHWSDVESSMREIYRVLKKNGIFILLDVCSPYNSLFDTFLQTIEVLRDPSHIRDDNIV